LRRFLLLGATLALVIALLAVWTTPPAPLLDARQVVVHTLRWISAHWLNAVAIGAAGSVMSAIVPFILWQRGRRGRHSVERASGQQARERAVILRRVQYRWASEAQEQSLADAAQLALGLTRRSDICQLGTWASRHQGQRTLQLPAGTTIVRLFDEVQGGLVILGAPGAGKTTLLCELASELMKRAEVDPGEPIPVVLNLASWPIRRQPLATWLAEELAVGYNVPLRTSWAWVAHDAMTVLLDGFDEVAERYRPACAEAINRYRQEHGIASMAVCSRTQAIEELTVRLHMDEAVELLPPTRAQIDRYFRYLEQTGTRLADVRAALDTDEALQELVRSPLMLHVIALAYHGRPALALERPGTAKQRKRQLWRAYVDRMFEQRPLNEHHRYSRPQAIGWLTWLARHLQQLEQTELRFDQLLYQFSQPGLWRKKMYVTRWLRLGVLAADPHLVPRERDDRTLRARLRDYVLEDKTSIIIGMLAGAVVMLAMAVFLGIAKGNADGPLSGLITALVTPLVIELPAVLIVALYFGTICLVEYLISRGLRFIRHWGVRGLLVGVGVAPWRYGAFLDAMTERLLLRRSGAGYVFVHALLRDYLADQASIDLLTVDPTVR
jgi:hypothetical protein